MSISFKQWLKEQCKNRIISDYDISLLDLLVLNDGLELSVQCSSKHYCYPKKTLKSGDYESVEVYTSDFLPSLLASAYSTATRNLPSSPY